MTNKITMVTDVGIVEPRMGCYPIVGDTDPRLLPYSPPNRGGRGRQEKSPKMGDDCQVILSALWNEIRQELEC